jgi:glutaminyl-peptide cyclotransferase
MKTAPVAAPRAPQKPRSAKWLALVTLGALIGAGLALNRAPQTTTTPPATSQTAQAPVAALQLGWKTVASYPHDSNAFTQGLVWHDGGFYEGTGLEGKSQLRRVAFPSGRVEKKIDLPGNLFGEGIALVGDKIFQITWQSKIGFIYERDTLKPLRQFSYENEGWGLTYDGQFLIQSDGTSTLIYRDAQSFQTVRQMPVTMNGQPLSRLNELEWIEGEIWANVWQTDTIVRIDPATGRVKSYLDLTGLLPRRLRTGKEDVMNGIAYDSETKRLFVTGKLWPRLFEIKVLDGAA